MFSNRISDQTRFLGMTKQYNSMLQQQMDLMSQISTGIRLQRADQDPIAAALVEQAHTQDAQLTQDQTNISEATSFAAQTENSLNTAMSLMQRADELAVSANDATKSPSDMKQIANEINQLLNGMVDTANSRYGDRNLFGGSATSTGTAPFTTAPNANGDVGAVTYQGNTDTLSTVAAPGVTVQYNLLGANNGNGAFIDTNPGGVDVFKTLIDLRDHLNTGNTAALNGDLQNIQSAVSHLSAVTTLTGTAQQRLQNQQTANNDMQTTLGGTLAKNENTDMAAAISQLSLLQTSYQAALKIGAQINQVSLLNYI